MYVRIHNIPQGAAIDVAANAGIPYVMLHPGGLGFGFEELPYIPDNFDPIPFDNGVCALCVSGAFSLF